MEIREHVALGPKTTMRIGGTARYFAELASPTDVEEAWAWAKERSVPIIALGGGSNTIFADGVIHALVVRVTHTALSEEGACLRIGAGHSVATLVREGAERGWDFSALSGIPGTLGGAIVGNAGQGPKGTWIDSFIETVTFFDGAWQTIPRDACGFGYRESMFKHAKATQLLYECVLRAPSGDPATIKARIESLLQKRMETQPHRRTAGSCFKASGSTPAWQLIEAAGLRGYAVGDIAISMKHANFLESGTHPRFDDAISLIRHVQTCIPVGLEVEMRCIDEQGRVVL